MKPRVTGIYNPRYYVVLVDGEEIYRAGNAVHDSQVRLPPGHRSAVSFETMREYCINTCKEVAEEYNGIFVGVEEGTTD